jgi:archaellum biogenesis ATPase FlaH
MARDALKAHGVLAVGTVCGAGHVPVDDVLRHLLGHPSILWADNAKDGRDHMQKIVERLRVLGHRDTRQLIWPDAPPKGDAVDYFAAGGTVEGLASITAATGRGPNHFRLIRPSQLSDEPIEYLIRKFVVRGWLTIIGGKDGKGKTQLAQEFTRAVLNGEKVFGVFAAKKGKVIALFLDDPENLTKKRLKALGILDHPDVLVSPELADDADPVSAIHNLEGDVRAHGIDLIIVDALYLLQPTSKDAGNDSARMKPIMKALDDLAKRTGAAVVLIAHDNKAGVDISGSAVIRQVAKIIVRVIVPDGEDAESLERTLQLNKNKDGGAESWRLRLDQYGWHFHGSTRDVRPADLRRRILETLAQHPGGQDAEGIAGYIGRRPFDVRGALDALVTENIARTWQQNTPGQKGRPRKLYAIITEITSPNITSSNTRTPV